MLAIRAPGMMRAKAPLAWRLLRPAIEELRLTVIHRPSALIVAAIFEGDGSWRDRLVRWERESPAEHARVRFTQAIGQ